MNPKQKKKIKQIIDVAFKIDIKEIFEKKLKTSPKGAYILLPSKYIGKIAKVIVFN